MNSVAVFLKGIFYGKDESNEIDRQPRDGNAAKAVAEQEPGLLDAVFECCGQAALDMIARKDFDVNIMTTHRFSFAETRKALDLVDKYEDGVVKAIIKF